MCLILRLAVQLAGNLVSEKCWTLIITQLDFSTGSGLWATADWSHKLTVKTTSPSCYDRLSVCVCLCVCVCVCACECVCTLQTSFISHFTQVCVCLSLSLFVRQTPPPHTHSSSLSVWVDTLPYSSVWLCEGGSCSAVFSVCACTVT